MISRTSDLGGKFSHVYEKLGVSSSRMFGCYFFGQNGTPHLLRVEVTPPPPPEESLQLHPQSWKLICILFFLSPLPPYTMWQIFAGLGQSSRHWSWGGGRVKIVTNMRNILIAWNLQQFVIIFKKSTDIFSMIESWKLICRLFFLSPLPPYTMLADLCRSWSVQPTLIFGGGGGGRVKIVTNMRNIYIDILHNFPFRKYPLRYLLSCNLIGWKYKQYLFVRNWR